MFSFLTQRGRNKYPPLKGENPTAYQPPTLNPTQQVIALYTRNKLSAHQIASHLNILSGDVYKILRDNGVTRRPKGLVKGTKRTRTYTEAELIDMAMDYEYNGLSIDAIATVHSCSFFKVRSALLSLGVPLKQPRDYR